MNQFLKATKEAISRNGTKITYKQKGETSYNPADGEVISNDNSFTVSSYPKHIRASQFHYPNLIGKESYMFYIAGDQEFTPSTSDLIVFDGSSYKIDSILKHFAGGINCLYRIIGVKG